MNAESGIAGHAEKMFIPRFRRGGGDCDLARLRRLRAQQLPYPSETLDYLMVRVGAGHDLAIFDPAYQLDALYRTREPRMVRDTRRSPRDRHEFAQSVEQFSPERRD